MSVFTLQGTLVGDARVAVGLGVGHVGAVFLVLAGVGEVHAVGVDVSAFAAKAQFGADTHVAAQGDHYVFEGGVGAYLDAVLAGV